MILLRDNCTEIVYACSAALHGMELAGKLLAKEFGQCMVVLARFAGRQRCPLQPIANESDGAVHWYAWIRHWIASPSSQATPRTCAALGRRHYCAAAHSRACLGPSLAITCDNYALYIACALQAWPNIDFG